MFRMSEKLPRVGIGYEVQGNNMILVLTLIHKTISHGADLKHTAIKRKSTGLTYIGIVDSVKWKIDPTFVARTFRNSSTILS